VDKLQAYRDKRDAARTPEPVVNGCRPLTPADLANLWNAPATPMPSRIRCEQLTSLPDEAIGELVRLAGHDSDSPIMLAQLRHLGGALAHDPPGGGAIGYCEAAYQLELLGMAPTPQADKTVRDHQHAITGALAPWITGTILPGFADLPDDTAERAYPAATRSRLRRVKARYDPDAILLPSFPLS